MRSSKLFWILTALSVSLFWGGWAMTYNSFYEGGPHRWIYPSIALFCASASLYLLIVVTRKARILFLVSCAATLPAVFLGREIWYNMIVIWVISMIYYIIAIKRIKVEQYNRIKINIYRILKRGIPIMGTGISFLIAAGFYFSIINQQEIGDIPRVEVSLSKKMTNGALSVANVILPTKELSWILEGVSIDEYILRMIQAQETSDGLNVKSVSHIGGEIQSMEKVSFSSLPEEKQDELVRINRAQLSEQLGVEVSGAEGIDQTINRVLNKRLSEIINGDLLSANVVPIGVAFGMFVTIRSLTWIFNGILFLFVTAIFALLVKLKAIVIKKETREVEDIL